MVKTDSVLSGFAREECGYRKTAEWQCQKNRVKLWN